MLSKIVGFLGELLLTVGAVVLLYVLYESYWTNIEAHQEQVLAQQELRDRWANVSTGPLSDGDAMAQIYIPSFGPDWRFTIVEGTNDDDLLRGPGHYRESQLSAEPGNFAVAGHRVGKGAPFNDLGLLKTCDAVVIETQTSWDTYRVLPTENGSGSLNDCMDSSLAARASSGAYANLKGRIITTPGNVSVVAPVPGDVNSTPNPDLLPVITLTTCHPQFSNAERMIIHGVLVESLPKTGNSYKPDILTG